MKISSKEWKFVLICSVLILIASSIPYIYAYIKTPQGMHFTGLIEGTDSVNTYLNWMHQAKEGKILFELRQTPEQVKPLLFNPLFLFLGKFSALTELSLIFTHHLFRIIFGFLLLITIYYFISIFIKDKPTRKIAFLFSTIASGFGYILWLFLKLVQNPPYFFSESIAYSSRIVPLEIATPEMNTFASIYVYPHFVFALILILLTYLLFYLGWTKNKLRFILLASLTSFVLAIIHPYDLIPILAITFIFSLVTFIKERQLNKIPKYFLFVTASIIPLFYHLFVLSQPIYNSWKNININLSPNPLSYIIGFGLLFILSLYYLFHSKKEFDYSKLFLCTWIIINFLLLYAPLNNQRRFVMALQIPLAIISAITLFSIILPKLSNKKLLIFLIFIIVIPSNALILLKDSYIATKNQSDYIENQKRYLYNEEFGALNWLSLNTKPDEIVLSAPVTSLQILGISGNKVFISERYITVNFSQKQENVKQFFAASTEPQKIKLLQDYNISYLYYGPEEKQLGSFSPDSVSYLKEIFNNSKVKIYKINIQHTLY